MNKNAEELYNELTSRGKFFDTQEAFEQELQTEDGAKFYYDLATKEGLWMDTFDGFKNDILDTQEKEESSRWEKVKSGISDLYWRANKEAREFKEEKEREDENAKKLHNYNTAGLTEQDQQDIAALEKVNQENPLLGYGKVSPVDISEETEKTLNRKSEMSSYIQRGEDPGTIHINAFERAKNTDEGKNLYNTLLNEAESEFISSDEYKELLEKYKLGLVNEEEIYKAFSDQYEEEINEKFAEMMLAKGTPIGDYIEVAEKKVYQKQGASDAIALEEKINTALEKSKQESNDKVREDYKKQYGVYPESDPMSDLKIKALQQSGSIGYLNQYDKTLIRAKKFNEEALTLINAVAKKDDFGDFWRGVGNAAADTDTWDLGIGELVRNVELLDVIKKLEHNETAPADQQLEITESEQMLLDAALNFFTVSAYYSNDLGRGYKAGQTSMASMPFMLEFVMSAGTMAAVDASVKGTARAGAAILVKQLRKRGMQKLAKATTGRVSHMVGGMASGIVSSAINAAYMTGVYGTARIAGGTVERMTGQVKPEWDNENKQFVYGGRKDDQGLGEALRNAAADTYIENLSEMVLAKTLDPMRAFVRGTDVFKKVAKNDLIGAISSIRNNPTFRSLRQATQFGGYFEEVAEEYLGGILRRAAMTDVNNWQQAGLDLDGQIDIFLGLAPTSLLFGATGAASYYGGIAYNSKKLKDSMSSDAQREMFDQLMKESRSGEFREGAHDFIRNVLLDGNISEDKKRDIIMGVAQEYQSVLSKKLQEQANNVATTEFEKEIDKFIGAARLVGTETIIESSDDMGRSFVIVGGKVSFNETTVDGEVVRTVDANNSSREIQVRYVKNDGTLTEEVSTLRTSNLNMPASEIGTEKFKGLKLAQYKASFASLDTFEYEDGIYDTKTGLFIRTKEEQEQIDASEQQIEEVAQLSTDAPTINTKPRIIVNEEYKVTVDGKQVTVKLTSIAGSPMVQREDGSIKSGDFVVTVDGKSIRSKEAKEDYINAVSEKLKADHAKAVEEYNKKKEEEAAANQVEPQPLISEEDRAARTEEQERQAKEAEKRAKIEALPKDKAGNVLVDKLSPEEYFLYMEQENGAEIATSYIAEQLAWEYQAIADIEASNKSPREKQTARMKHQAAIKGYEDAIVKYVGQEALDQMTAARNEVVAEEAPVAEEPVIAEEESVAEEAHTVEPAPAETVTTPLPLAEGTETIDETPAPPVVEVKEGVEEVTAEEKPSYDIETEVENGTIKLMFSPNSKGQWYVVRNGEIISKSRNANSKKLPDNVKEVSGAKIKYIQTVDGNYMPILLFSESVSNESLKGEKQVMLQDGSVTSVKASEMFDKIGENEYIPTQSNSTKREAQRKEKAKYSTFDAILGYPVVRFSDGSAITFADVMGIGFTKKSGSQYTTPYNRVIEMIDERESNEEIRKEKKKAFRDDFKKMARYWNSVVDSKYEGKDELKMAIDLSVGKHDTSGRTMASAIIAVDNAISNGYVSVKVEDQYLTIPAKWGGEEKKTTWLKNMTDEEIVEQVTVLTEGLEEKIAAYTALEEKQKRIEDEKKAAETFGFEVNVDEMTEEELKSMEELGVSINKQQRAVRDFLKKLNEQQLKLVDKSISPSQLYAKKVISKAIDKIQQAGTNAKATTNAENKVAEGISQADNSKNNELQRLIAKRKALEGVNSMTEQEALSIYRKYISGNAPANMTAEQLEKAIEMLKESKHGKAIVAEEARVRAAQEEILRMEQEAAKEAEEKPAEPTASEEVSTPTKESLRADIEKLSKELDYIDSLAEPTQEQLDRADAIFAEIQEKNTLLDAMGNKWEEKTDTSAAAAQAVAMQEIADEEAGLEKQRETLREELNALQGNINEFVYETDEEIDAANARIDEIKEQLSSLGEFMIGEQSSQPLTKAEDLALSAALASTNGMIESVSFEEANEELRRNNDTEFMGSRVNKRMDEIAEYFLGKELSDEQQAIVDVFSGRADNITIPIKDASGSEHKLQIRQGNELNAGTKHIVYRHYNTGNSPINADDILLIPAVIKNGAAETVTKNGKDFLKYAHNINGTEYVAYVEKKRGRESLITFYSNKKTAAPVSSDTQLSAQNNDATVSGDKGTTNISNDQINLQNKSNASFFIEQGGKIDVVSADMVGKNSVVLGYAKDGKIYLTPAGMNANTVIHEYTHIWAKSLQQNNPQAWKSIVDILKKSKELWNEVLNDPNYENIKDDENAVASEVLSRYSGKNGAARLEADAKRVIIGKKGVEKDVKVKSLIARVRKALTEFWSWVGKDLFKIESFESIDSIADRVLYDMLNNTRLNQQSQTSTAEREQIIAEAKANGTYMTAPNGQPTNLTEDQWVTVRTQAFKDYFGDWINDKDNASVVLDENGEPLVVFHGSRMAGFDQFGRGEARDSQGIYTTPNRRAAESYATSVEEWKSEQTMPEAELGVPDHHGVYSLFVNMRNPKVIDFGGKRFDEYGEPKYEVATNEALDYGERGILFDTLEEAEAYIAEHPEEDLDYVEKRTTSDDMLVQAKEEGYDGVIFTNIIDSRYPDPITNYVPFESNQVKSATQNIGTFNPEDNRIEFMIGPAPSSSSPITSGYDQRDGMTIDDKVAARLQVKSKDYMAALANPKAQLPDELNAMNEWVAKLLDRTEGIRQIMESIKKFRKENGLPTMGEGFDVRTMVEAMDSKIANETKLYVETKENELRTCVFKLAKKVKDSEFYKKYKYEQQLTSKGEKIKLYPRDIIERYLIACDSIEREELKGNPRGLGDFLSRMGVDVVQFRDEFLQEFASTKEGGEEINKLWDAIRGVTDMVITEGERSGLLSSEEVIEYSKRRFYVPERDFAEVEADEDLRAIYDAGISTGGRMGVKLLAEQRAKGGDTLAANVFANMTLLARDAIVKANKNIVKVAMFDLLRANEEWCRAKHIPVPRQIWYVKNDKGKYVRQDDGPSAEDRKLFKSLKHEIRMREDEILLEQQLAEAATEPAVKQGHLDNIEDIKQEIESLRNALPYLDEFDTRDLAFHQRGTKHDYTVTVFVDGVPCEMNFPNMTTVAHALNGTFNTKMTAGYVKKLTNAISATMTVYNPAFFSVNVVRDIPFVLAKGYAEFGWKFAPKFIGQLAKTAFKADVWRVIWSGDYKNAKDKYVREFFEGGGNTGYGTIPDINRLKNKWNNWHMQGVQIGLSKVGDVISYMNTFSEVWTRLAAYSVVRDMGGTKEDGIRAAKNLSVNFNRRGLGAPMWDAFISCSYFANAAIQGATGFMRVFHGNKDTAIGNAAVVFRAANAFMFVPMFAGFLATLLSPDDNDEFLQISNFDRDNYFYLGNTGVRFALNEQLKPLWVIGVNIALGMKGRRTKEEIKSSILSSLFTNWLPAPTNVTSSATMFTQWYYETYNYKAIDALENLFVPQAFGTVVDLGGNADFMGYRIKPESGDLPAYMLNENSAAIYKKIAEMFYDAHGGDQVLNTTHIEVVKEDGTIRYEKMRAGNISPKQVKTFLSPIMNTSLQDFASLVINAIDGDLGKPADYITIKRFYKPREQEMAIFTIAKEARAIIKDHDKHLSNMYDELYDAELTNNKEKEAAARARIDNLERDEDIKKLKAYINAYDATTIYSYAKKFNMSEVEFMRVLNKRNPEMAEAFDDLKSTKREEMVRKLMTLTRDIRGEEVEDKPIIDKIENFFGVDE